MISETAAAALITLTFVSGFLVGAATVVDGRLPFCSMGVRALLLLGAAAINFIAAIGVAVWSVG
ncbi:MULTISPECIES: hypothetical protein [Rhodoplanes]|uniref:hypothetical protein n=1 Tax=Rhodoplanes TaxID=29407 RepID=UPI00101DF75B|nr:hypothetical protein [Rhodoplanes serenus]